MTAPENKMNVPEKPLATYPKDLNFKNILSQTRVGDQIVTLAESEDGQYSVIRHLTTFDPNDTKEYAYCKHITMFRKNKTLDEASAFMIGLMSEESTAS